MGRHLTRPEAGEVEAAGLEQARALAEVRLAAAQGRAGRELVRH